MLAALVPIRFPTPRWRRGRSGRMALPVRWKVIASALMLTERRGRGSRSGCKLQITSGAGICRRLREVPRNILQLSNRKPEGEHDHSGTGGHRAGDDQGAAEAEFLVL